MIVTTKIEKEKENTNAPISNLWTITSNSIQIIICSASYFRSSSQHENF